MRRLGLGLTLLCLAFGTVTASARTNIREAGAIVVPAPAARPTSWPASSASN
jgi:hypothetical protein